MSFLDDLRSEVMSIPNLPFADAYTDAESYDNKSNMIERKIEEIRIEQDQLQLRSKPIDRRGRSKTKIANSQHLNPPGIQINMLNDRNISSSMMDKSFLQRNALVGKKGKSQDNINVVQRSKVFDEVKLRPTNIFKDKSFLIEEDLSEDAISQESRIKTTKQTYQIKDLLQPFEFKKGDEGRIQRQQLINYMNRFKKGSCKICLEEDCPLYIPSDTISIFKEPLVFLECAKCGCPLSNHYDLEFDVFLTNAAVTYMSELQFTEEMIQENQVIAIIADNNDLSIERKKVTTENIFSMITKKLASNGFEVTDKYMLTKEEIISHLIRKYLLANPQGIDLKIFEKIMRGDLEVIRGPSSKYPAIIKWENIFPAEFSQASNSSRRILEKIYLLVEETIVPVMNYQNFFAICIDCPKVSKKYNALLKITKNLEIFLTKYNQRLFYFSENNKAAFLDKQIFFEQEYVVEKTIKAFLPSAKEEPYIRRERGTFEDIMTLNSLKIIKQINNVTGKVNLENELKLTRHENTKHIYEILYQNPNATLALSFGFPHIRFKDHSFGSRSIISTSDPISLQKISSKLFPSKSKDELALIVIRPLLLKQGFDELIINLFRVNDMVILERVYKTLNDYEINMLASVENIHPSSFSNYVEIMGKGDVCIVLLSGTCSTDKINYIINGGSFDSASIRLGGIERGLINIEMETLMDFFINESSGKVSEDSVSKLLGEGDPYFKGLKYLLNYEFAFLKTVMYTVVPKFIPEETPSDRIINKRLFKRAYSNFKEFSEVIEHFNPNVFSPLSTRQTFELAAVFMPEAIKRTTVDIIIHPLAIEFSDSIIDLLAVMNFTIVWSCLGKLDEHRLEKFFEFGANEFVQFNKNAATKQWLNQHYMLLRLARTGARMEIGKLMETNEIVKDKGVMKDELEHLDRYNLDEFIIWIEGGLLRNVFYTASSDNFPPKLLLKPIINDMPLFEKTSLIKFLSKNCYSSSDINPNKISNSIVRQKRILDRTALITEAQLEYSSDSVDSLYTVSFMDSLYPVQTTEKMKIRMRRKMWLSKIYNYYFQQKASSFYVSDYFPFDENVPEDNALLKHMFIECEEKMGPCFIKTLLRSHEEYYQKRAFKRKEKEIRLDETTYTDKSRLDRSRMDKSRSRLDISQDKADITNETSLVQEPGSETDMYCATRGSIVAFVFGGTLAKWVNKVEAARATSTMNDLFPEYIGVSEQNETYLKQDKLMDDEYDLLRNIIDELIDISEDRHKHRSEELLKKLDDIFKNEVYSIFREQKHLYFVPSVVTIQNLRFFKKKQKLKTQQLYPKVYARGYEEENEDLEYMEFNFDKGMNFDYAIQGSPGTLCGKHRLVANIRELIKNELLKEFEHEACGVIHKDTLGQLAISFSKGFEEHYQESEDDINLMNYLYKKNLTQFEARLSDSTRNPDGFRDNEYHSLQNFNNHKPFDIRMIETVFYYITKIGEKLEELAFLRGPQNFRLNKSPESISRMEDDCYKLIFQYVDQALLVDLRYTPSEDFMRDGKEFIRRERYFQDNFTVGKFVNLFDKRYEVEVLKPEGPTFFESFGHFVTFIKEDRLDDNQKRWLSREGVKVHYMRPAKMPKDGIYVDRLDPSYEFKGDNHSKFGGDEFGIRNFANIKY